MCNAETAIKPNEPTTALKRTTLSALTLEKKHVSNQEIVQVYLLTVKKVFESGSQQIPQKLSQNTRR